MSTVTKRFLSAINYRGTFATLAEIKALPEPVEGDWAKLDKGAGTLAKRFDYDAQDGWLPENPSSKFRELVQYFDFNLVAFGEVFTASSGSNGTASTTIADYAAGGMLGYASIGATVAGSYYALRSTNAVFYPVSGVTFELEGLVSFSSLGASSESYISRFGFMSSLNFSNGGTNSVSFVYDQASLGVNWQCECRAGNITTRIDSNVAASSSSFQHLRVVTTSGSCKFYINNALVATITTNIPTYADGGMYLALSHIRSATATTTKFTRIAFAKLGVLYTTDASNRVYSVEFN